jgi:hypothetical protein
MSLHHNRKCLDGGSKIQQAIPSVERKPIGSGSSAPRIHTRFSADASHRQSAILPPLDPTTACANGNAIRGRHRFGSFDRFCRSATKMISTFRDRNLRTSMSPS